MKRISLLLLMAFVSMATYAQSLDDIVSKVIEAQGGLEKINALKSIITHATSEADGMTIPITISVLDEEGMRVDLSIMGTENYVIANRTVGYTYFPVSGQTQPEKMTDDEHKASIYQFDLQGPWVDWKTKGYKLELQGEEDVDGTMCYLILVVDPSKTETRYYVEKESYYVIKSVEKQMVNGSAVEINSEYGDFRDIDGYTMPFEILSDQMGQVKVDKYEINPKIDLELFRLPK